MSSRLDDALARARTHFLAGTAAFQAGRLPEAAVELEAARALAPDRPSVLLNLAATRLALGEPQSALPLLQALLERERGDAQAWCHHGSALAALGRDREALASFERALALPDAPPVAALQHAAALRRLGAMEQALAALEAACQARPDDASPWIERGQALAVMHRHDEAEACWRRACALPDAPARAFGLLGSLLKDSQRLDEARQCLQRALALDPGDAAVRFLIAALGGIDAPPLPPAHYVQGLFDDYAPRFDAHLVGALGYCAPQRLAALLPAMPDGASVLDLGCGTGLMAQALVDAARPRLLVDGVDLSRAMLDAARARGLYRHLVQADAASHLAATDQRYDWVLATDVFIYIGALEPVFAGVARVLKPGGGFGFSVERLDAAQAGSSGWQLRPHSRYAHAEDYLCRLAASHHLSVQCIEAGPLRHEQKQAVEGQYLVLRAA